MKPAPFRHYAPTTADEAVAPQDGRMLAGGQSLVPTRAFRLAHVRYALEQAAA